MFLSGNGFLRFPYQPDFSDQQVNNMKHSLNKSVVADGIQADIVKIYFVIK